jgi:hypothetical protein
MVPTDTRAAIAAPALDIHKATHHSRWALLVLAMIVGAMIPIVAAIMTGPLAAITTMGRGLTTPRLLTATHHPVTQAVIGVGRVSLVLATCHVAPVTDILVIVRSHPVIATRQCSIVPPAPAVVPRASRNLPVIIWSLDRVLVLFRQERAAHMSLLQVASGGRLLSQVAALRSRVKSPGRASPRSFVALSQDYNRSEPVLRQRSGRR